MASPVRILLLIIILTLWSIPAGAGAGSTSGEIQQVRVCKSPSRRGDRCAVLPVWQVDSQDRTIWLSAPVHIESHGPDPMAVFIKAFAASAVYWDGKFIGQNGRPGEGGAPEIAGLRDAAIPVPSELSHPGPHRLEIQMSTMRAPVRLASPVLAIRIAPFEEPLQPALRNYLPALLTAGGLVALMLFLAALGWKQGRVRELACAIAGALFVAVQLAAESSRAFVPLRYPAQVQRLELVFLCACAFGLLLAGHLVERFEIGRRKRIWSGQAAIILSGAWLFRGLDAKTAWAILSSAAVCISVCAVGMRQRRSGAVSLMLVFGVCLFLGVSMPATFLDRDFYLWALGLVAVLLAQQARPAFERPQTGSVRSVPVTPLLLGSGRTRHLVPPGQIVRLAAADDYTEVFLADTTTLLHPEPLHKLLARLPADFVRVHRSHAINLAHLRSFRRGAKSNVTLSDRSVAPVSRRCLPKLIEAIPV